MTKKSSAEAAALTILLTFDNMVPKVANIYYIDKKRGHDFSWSL